MNLNQQIQKLRPYPQKLSIKTEIVFSVVSTIIGIALGFIAKMTDSISIIGEIGTEIGIWIFVATLIAAFSHYPLSAAINVFLFFISVLFAYYTYGQLVLGFFPQSYFYGWLIMAFISPIAGIAVWFSKADKVIGSVVTALPVALLFAHGFPVFYTLRL